MPNTAIFDITDGTTTLSIRPDTVSAQNVLMLEDDSSKPVNELAKVNYDRPKSSTTIRRSLRLNLPQTVTKPDGSQEVIWLTGRLELIADPRSTADMRESLIAYMASLTQNAGSKSTFVSPEWFW